MCSRTLDLPLCGQYRDTSKSPTGLIGGLGDRDPEDMAERLKPRPTPERNNPVRESKSSYELSDGMSLVSVATTPESVKISVDTKVDSGAVHATFNAEDKHDREALRSLVRDLNTAINSLNTSK